jgi:hypothetical protein
MALETQGIQYPWLRDLDRAMLLLGELEPGGAAKTLTDARDWRAFCETHRLMLDGSDVEELKALYRA